MSLIAEVLQALKILDKGTVSELLELLQKDFSAEWVNPKIQRESIRRKIKHKLDALIEMDLVITEEKTSRHQKNIYAIKHNFPTQTKASQLTKELLNIVRADKKIYLQSLKIINDIFNEINSPYFVHKHNEDIGSKREIIGKLETAINDKLYTKITYNAKTIKIRPLKIAEFDGLWYLLHYYDKYRSYLKYRLLEIENVVLTKDKFTVSKKMDLEIKKWHNVWHVPNVKPTKVTLWIDKGVKKYFDKKNLFNINDYPEKITPCSDGIEFDIHITHPYEILPTLMQYQPYVTIVRQEGTIDITEKYRKILDTASDRLGSA